MGMEDFFPKNAFHGGTNFVGKIYRDIVLHEATNDQIISNQEGGSFTKCIFHQSEH